MKQHLIIMARKEITFLVIPIKMHLFDRAKKEKLIRELHINLFEMKTSIAIIKCCGCSPDQLQSLSWGTNMRHYELYCGIFPQSASGAIGISSNIAWNA
jgi:hypothetical protein